MSAAVTLASRLRELRSARAIWRDNRGVSAIEFAAIAPTFLLLLIGMLDLGHFGYARSILNAAVQEAARSSAMESGDTAAADTKVLNTIKPVIPAATLTSQRASYRDFADIARPERWNDSDNDGTCDVGETYTDENGDGNWDTDVAISGNGGANDVVVYTVTIRYNPIFTVPFFPESWNQRTLKATAVRKNQPFANQDSYGSTARVC